MGQAGYQGDSDTGRMLLGHRYYDAGIGRFLSRDPIQDGRNWYVYTNNDPANKFDSDGLISNWLRKRLEKIGVFVGAASTLGGFVTPVKAPGEAPPVPPTSAPLNGTTSGGGVTKKNEDNDDTGSKAIVIGVVVWETVKWTAAIIAAPETAGGSIAGAALIY